MKRTMRLVAGLTLFFAAIFTRGQGVGHCDAVEVIGSGAERYDRLVCRSIEQIEKGKLKKAIGLMEKALSVPILGKPNFELLSRLAWTYRQLGNEEKAAILLLEAELTLNIVVGVERCSESTEEDGFALTITEEEIAKGEGFDISGEYFDTVRDMDNLVPVLRETLERVERRMCGAAYTSFYKWKSFERRLWEEGLIKNYMDVREGNCPPVGCGNTGYGRHRPRNDTSYGGLELPAVRSGSVYAFANGVVDRFGYAYSDDPSYKYVMIITDDGHFVRQFHVEPYEQIIGQRVSLGEEIGKYQEIRKRYPDAEEHIRIEVWRDRRSRWEAESDARWRAKWRKAYCATKTNCMDVMIEGKYVDPKLLGTNSRVKGHLGPIVGAATVSTPVSLGGEDEGHCNVPDIDQYYLAYQEYLQLVCSAEIKMQEGNYEEAVRIYREALEPWRFHEGHNYDQLPELSWAYFQLGDMEEARDALMETELVAGIYAGILECREETGYDLQRVWDGARFEGEIRDRAASRMCSAFGYFDKPDYLESVLWMADYIRRYMDVKQRMEEGGLVIGPSLIDSAELVSFADISYIPIGSKIDIPITKSNIDQHAVIHGRLEGVHALRLSDIIGNAGRIWSESEIEVFDPERVRVKIVLSDNTVFFLDNDGRSILGGKEVYLGQGLLLELKKIIESELVK